MTIQFNNLTIEADVQDGRYEVTSARDEAGQPALVSPALLDEIEAAIEDELQAAAYDEAWLNCEMPHLMMGRY